MIPFRKILFPVDFSEPCQLVAPYVKDMVRQFSSELVVLRAVELPRVLITEGMAEAGLASIVSPPEIHKRQAEQLDEFISNHLADVKLRKILKEGEPASVIHETVKHEGADLVMMPTYGAGAFRRLLLGSVTAKVLHDVDCAVWTGAHASITGHKPALPYKSVVCALGLADESRAVLHGAGAIARAYGAKLHIVHSVETPPAAYEIDYGPFRKELITAAEDALRKLRAEAQIDAPIAVDSGAIADVVREQCEARHADLVITGRGHAQGGLSRVWSALYSIVREAPCPVLSI